MITVETSNIYIITNKINNKKYVGQTINPEKRFKQHIKDSRSKRHKNIYLYNAFYKYGVENFEFKVIETHIPLNIIDDREKYWIKEINSKKPNGYNLTDGGEGTFGYKHTEESKLKMSINSKGKSHPQSTETRMKIAESNRRRIITEETKEKISKANKGKKLTEKQKQNLSNILKGIPKSEEHKEIQRKIWENKTEEEKEKILKPFRESRRKAVLMLDYETEKIIMRFDSVRQASLWVRENTEHKKAGHQRIALICRGEDISAYGYKWKYE